MFSRYVGIDQSLRRLVLKRYRSFRCINIQRAAIKAADFFCNSNAGNSLALQGVRNKLRLK